jgi:hypothetical protein
MQDRLFRKVALERASSPERLDTLIAVSLVALGIWSVAAEVYTIVEGEGALVQQGESLQAVLYLTAEQVQNVTPGLAVLIAPVSISTQEYGFIRGQVVSIATQPTESGNTSTGASVFEVRIDLEQDNNTPTGYAWTIGNGPTTILRPTTAVTGRITIKITHPISQLFSNS